MKIYNNYKLKVLFFFFLMILTTSSSCLSADSNGDFMPLGPSFDDCSTFVDTIDSAKKNDNWTRWNKFRYFTLGYFTGLNQLLPDTFNIKGDSLSTEGTIEIMDKLESYCRKKPEDLYMKSLMDISQQLYKTRMKESPYK